MGKLITAQRAAQLCGLTAPTFANYSRTNRPTRWPAPKPVERDMDTGCYLYDEDEVIGWEAGREKNNPAARAEHARNAGAAGWNRPGHLRAQRVEAATRGARDARAERQNSDSEQR